MPFAATWMDLEIIIQSEVCPTQKDNTIWYHLYVESKMWYKWTNLWNRSRFANIKNRLVVVKVGGIQFSPVQLLSRIWLFATPWASAHQASLSFTISWKLAQTHVHWVSDAIQPSHPLSSPFSPAFHLSQHQGLFQWFSSSYQVAKVLEFQLQHQSFQWIIQNWFPLGWTGWISFLSKGLSRVFSNTTVQKHQFFSGQLSS